MLRFLSRPIKAWPAVGLVAASCLILPARCHGASAEKPTDRLAALVSKAEQLMAPANSERECAEALPLLQEGRKLIAGNPALEVGLRLRFYRVAAIYDEDHGNLRLAADDLENAAGLAEQKDPKGKDAIELQKRMKELRAVDTALSAARASHAAGKNQEAVEMLERALKEHPQCARHIIGWLAHSYTGVGRGSDAEALYRQSAERFKGTRFGDWCLRKTVASFMGRKEYDKALAALQESLKLYGDRADRGLIHVEMARCYTGLGKKTEALREIALARNGAEWMAARQPTKQGAQRIREFVDRYEREARALP